MDSVLLCVSPLHVTPQLASQEHPKIAKPNADGSSQKTLCHGRHPGPRAVCTGEIKATVVDARSYVSVPEGALSCCVTKGTAFRTDTRYFVMSSPRCAKG